MIAAIVLVAVALSKGADSDCRTILRPAHDFVPRRCAVSARTRQVTYGLGTLAGTSEDLGRLAEVLWAFTVRDIEIDDIYFLDHQDAPVSGVLIAARQPDWPVVRA
jgi:hypothetical protein